MSADRTPPPETATPSADVDRVSTAGERIRSWPVMIGAAVVIAALVWLTSGPNDDLRSVQNGRRFSAIERREAESVLRGAGIKSVRGSGNQLQVGADSVAAADQALAETSGTTRGPTNRFQAANSLFDQFTTGRRQEQADSAARAAQVSRLLEQQPAVASAEIVWDEEPQVGRRRMPRVRASVFLKPASGCTIGLDTVHAVRLAVAGSRAHLTPADVVVMDLHRQITYDAPQDKQALVHEAQLAELTGTYRGRIESALSDIPGVQVYVRLQAAPESHAERIDSGPALSVDTPQLAAADSSLAAAPRSGPNMRLEVSPVAYAGTSSGGQPAAAYVDPVAQLEIAVQVPADVVETSAPANGGSRDTHAEKDPDAAVRQRQFEVRQRIAAAVARAVPPRAGVNLSVAFDAPVSPAGSSSPAPTSLATVWNLARAFGGDWPPGRAIMMLLMLPATGMWLGRRWLFRRRQIATPSGSDVDRATTERQAETGALSEEPPVVVVQPPDRIDAAFMPGADVAVWASVVAEEPASVVAGLLLALSPDEVAHVMARLSPDRQHEVLRLTPAGAINGPDLERLRQRVQARIASLPSSASAAARGPHRAGKRLASRLPKSSRLAADATFDSLSEADEESLQALIETVPDETWSVALLASAPELRQRLSRVAGDRRRFGTQRDHRPMRLHEIESAQRLILSEWRSLAAGNVRQ